MEEYKKSVAQLFLHSSLNGKSFDDYIFKELLTEKLHSLYIDLEEELKVYETSILNAEKPFTIITKNIENIPVEARFGVYCHCVQLGILTLIDNPINSFFLILQVAMNVSTEKDKEIRNIFSEMMLTFFGHS